MALVKTEKNIQKHKLKHINSQQ